MSKINNEEDFKKIIEQINSFSHAYILNTNNLQETLKYAKIFAKAIIMEKIKDEEEMEDISYKIEQNIFDDLYIVDPNTLSINNEEIEKLLKYMSTKSIRNNGRRVYIINGLERITRDISNKILKFLEEPEEGIFAILITNGIEKVLSTIISRAQVINLSFKEEEVSNEFITKANDFLNMIFIKKEKTIAYTSNILGDITLSREDIYKYFETMENIISNSIKKKNQISSKSIYDNPKLDDLKIDNLVNILDITNKLKQLIKKNININLLFDRYIIEVAKEV